MYQTMSVTVASPRGSVAGLKPLIRHVKVKRAILLRGKKRIGREQHRSTYSLRQQLAEKVLQYVFFKFPLLA